MRDQLVADLAARQGGQVSTAQLRALGLDGSAVARRVAAGRLHRGPRGVYAVGHRRTDIVARRWSALLIAGPRAVLNDATAGAVWDLHPEPGGPVHVAVPGGGGRAKRRGIVLHRPALAPEDVTTHNGYPVTTVERTLLDLAANASEARFEAAFERAEFLRLTRSRELDRVTAGAPPGSARLRAARAEPLTVTRSALERRMLALCRRHGIERPLVNQPFGAYEIDFLWPSVRLAVEADGGEFHRTRRAFEHDRRRDATLTAAGLRVVRFTHRQITHEPDATAAMLVAVGAPVTSSSR
jgi:very-short-patch-repair endonuclease